ncbi:hypothetical protein ACFWIO_17245 [Streptomyces diastatochromogenes]
MDSSTLVRVSAVVSTMSGVIEGAFRAGASSLSGCWATPDTRWICSWSST